jgi:hypothetical protein
MNCRQLAVVTALSIVAASAAADPVPVDLTTWSALTLDYPGGQAAGNWVLQDANTAVKQIVNADPSFYLNNLNQTNYSIDGKWKVDGAAGDNDYMGFAFGYQNSSNFYLFDWKAGTQGYVGRTAAEGMTIKRFEGATGNGLVDLSLEEFWENQVSFGDMTVLDTNHSSTAGWASGVVYTFHLDFNVNPGELHVVVKRESDGVTLWDTTINDATFTGGQFAFFNNSQANVVYSSFTQTGGDPVTPVPEPETYALMLAGLGMLGWASRRRRR